MSIDLSRIDWIALGAIATALLAAATVWLGVKTRQVANETRQLAKSTEQEIDLTRQATVAATAQAKAANELARAADEQAKVAREQFEAFQRQRKEDARPYFRWDQTSCSWGGPDPENRYIELNLQATNFGAIAVVPNLEVNATKGFTQQPLSLGPKLVPTGEVQPVHLRFGPIRQDIDFAFTGTAKFEAKSPNWGEILSPTAEFRCRIYDGGQLECDTQSRS